MSSMQVSGLTNEEFLIEVHRRGFEEMREDSKFLEMPDGSMTIWSPLDIPHSSLNPWLYADMKEFNLTVLAKFLDCPSKWKRMCTSATKNQRILRAFYTFRDSPECAPEGEVSAKFALLANEIARFVRADVYDDLHYDSVVGGLLFNERYNSISHVTHVYTHEDRAVMAVCVKSTFKEDDYWYRGNHAHHVYSALYSTNSPTFLISQKKWKIFFENTARDTVYTQVGSGGRSIRHNCTLIANIDADFIKAITLCFLSGKAGKVLVRENIGMKRRASVEPTYTDYSGNRRKVRVYSKDEVADVMRAVRKAEGEILQQKA